MPQVEVTFDIDANGILNVSAKDKATDKEQKITITASTNLSKEDVDRLVREARSHATEDKCRRELVEARNAAESLIYQADKSMRELGERVPASDRERIERQIGELRAAMQSDDVGQIKQGSEALQQMSYALGQQSYAEREVGGAEANGNGVQGETVEGEFHEV